jgi:hypothetical protein
MRHHHPTTDYALASCILLIVLTPNACSPTSSEPEPFPTTINLIPLSAGNQWNFIRSYFDTLGNITGSQAESLYFLGDTLIDGESWTCRYYYGYNLAYRNTPSGVMIRLLAQTSTPGNYLLYPCPGFLGVSYSYPTVWFAGYDVWIADTTRTIRIISADSIVNVPAGNFKCYQYRVEKRTITHPLLVGYSDEFMSPTYGWIRTVGYGRWRIGEGVFLTSSLDLQTLQLK